MCSAIKQAEDAWWDSQNHCVVMRADTELDQILELDQDIFFLDMTVEVEMGNLTKQAPNKEQMDLMSTGSILTFRSTVMTTSQPTMKHQACKTQKSQPNTISNQVLVMAGATLSAQDINTLLEWLLNAMQAKHLINPTQKAAGSQQTSKTKWDQQRSGNKTLAGVWPIKKAMRTQCNTVRQGKTERQQPQTQQESSDQNQIQTQQDKNKQNKQKNHKTWGDEIRAKPANFIWIFLQIQGELLPWKEDSSN